MVRTKQTRLIKDVYYMAIKVLNGWSVKFVVHTISYGQVN